MYPALVGYKATLHRDGTRTVHDLPLFIEHECVDQTGTHRVVDRDWLDRCLKKHQRRAVGWAPDGHDGNYYAPATVHHSVDKLGRPQKTLPAGRVVPKRLERRMYEGELRWTLIGDIAHMPGRCYRRVKSRELPYLSSEVEDYDDPELFAVALMPSTAPFFRCPMVEIDEEVPERAPSRTKPTPAHAVYAAGATGAGRRRPIMMYRAQGRRIRTCYALGGAVPMEGIREKLIAAISAAIMEAMPDEAPPAAPPLAADPAAGEPGPAEETMPGVEDLPLGGEGEMIDEEIDEEPDGMIEEEDVETYCDDLPPAAQGRYSALQMKNAQLEARLDAMEARALAGAAIAKADAKLRHLGVATPERLAKIRTYAAQGPKTLATYLETLENEVVPHLPPSDWDGEQTVPASRVPGSVKGDKDVMTYAAKGPAVLRQAAELAKEYDAFAKIGRKPRCERAAYIEAGLAGVASNGGSRR